MNDQLRFEIQPCCMDCDTITVSKAMQQQHDNTWQQKIAVKGDCDCLPTFLPVKWTEYTFCIAAKEPIGAEVICTPIPKPAPLYGDRELQGKVVLTKSHYDHDCYTLWLFGQIRIFRFFPGVWEVGINWHWQGSSQLHYLGFSEGYECLENEVPATQSIISIALGRISICWGNNGFLKHNLEKDHKLVWVKRLI